MLQLVRPRMLVLATMTCLSIGCGHPDETPQPRQPAPVAFLSTHTVSVRYQVRPGGGASQGLPQALNLLVEYERVGQTGPTSYRLLPPTVELHDPVVRDSAQEAFLSRVAAHPGTLRPYVTVTIWEEQALPTAARTSYEVTCDLVLDGKVAGRTTYSVVAGQVPPLMASSRTQIMP